MSNRAQRSFAGGEIAPSLYARTDLAKYQSAVRTLTNFVVRKFGGLENRAGSQFVAEDRDSTKTIRLVKFVFNSDQTYILEFGNGYIRFYRDGAQLLSGGLPYEIATPYLEADLMELRFVQSADVITITHHSYAPRELSRLGDTNWTLEQIVFGASIGTVTNLSASGAAGADTVYYAVTAVDALTGEEGLPAFYTLAAVTSPTTANPVTVTWDPLSGASNYRVFRSTDGGVTYELISDGGGVPTSFTDTTWVDDSETASTVGTSGAWVTAAGAVENAVIAGGANKPSDQRFTFKGIITITCSLQAAVSGRLLAYYSRDAEPDVLVGTIESGGVIGDGVSGGIWSEFFTASITVPDNGYAALTLKVVPQVWSEGADPAETSDCTADFVTDPTYNRITWQALGTGYVDKGADGDPLQSPPRDRQLFTSVNDYPLAVGIYQQRRLLGNTINDPEMNWTSRTGAYKNFFVSRPLQDDDAITWSAAGRQVNQVMHYLDLGKLIVFTNGSEMTVEGDDAGILRPDAINPRKFSANGSGRLPPIEVSDSAVYMQSLRNIVRSLVPLETSNSYRTTDLSLYAAHLFNGYTIEDWDYALAPHSILWLVRSDGVLLGLTYLPEEEIWAWHKHTTDGTIERVCTVPEGAENAVYIVVKRNINGTDKRYIERIASRFFTDREDAVFVDCSLSYDGAPATVFSGLDHLEGENVSVVADGVVKHNPNDASLPVKTVVAGSITLAAAASKVHVGLPYMSDLETLDIDSPQGQSVKDRRMAVGNVRLYVEESKRFYAGQNSTDLYLAQASDWTTDVIDVTIDSTWNSHGRIFVRHKDPLPLTILAAIPQGSMP